VGREGSSRDAQPRRGHPKVKEGRAQSGNGTLERSADAYPQPCVWARPLGAQVLAVHTKRMPLAADVDLPAIAHSTAGFTGGVARLRGGAGGAAFQRPPGSKKKTREPGAHDQW